MLQCNLESQLLGGLSFGQAVSQDHRVTLSYLLGNSLSESIRNKSGRHNGIRGHHCEGQRTRAGNLLHNHQKLLGLSCCIIIIITQPCT